MEYARFGPEGTDDYVEREDASEEWRPAERVTAKLAIIEKKEARLIAREAFLNAHTISPDSPDWGAAPRKLMARIIRSPENEARAAKLGLTADEMADRLARPDENDGTNTRLPEAEFDAVMAELNLSPEEARARFNGSFFTT